MADELGVDQAMPILKKNRMSTGITDLDVIMEGGHQNPANILLVGPSGTEKAVFAYHFAAAAGKNENTYIICGNTSPDDIVNKAANNGIDLNKENIKFIDCYSSTLGKGEIKSTPKVTLIDGPSALNDISLALNEAVKESQGKRIRFVFDTFSTFVLYNPKDSIRKFLGVIEGRLKSANATTLYLIDEGVHDKQLISLIEHGMDGKYLVVEKEGKFFLDIPGANTEIPIRVGPTGITVM